MRRALRVRLATTILFLSLLPVAIYFMICSVIADAVTRPLRKEIEQTPLQSGLAHVEAVSFGTDDRITLQGYFLPSSGDRAIVLVHGVHSHCWDGQSPDLSRALIETGFSVLVFDLRAHGRSGGERVGLGWRERQDVSAAVKFLRSRGFNSGKIGIHGTSYGAATALLAAVTVPEIGAVVADSAFADIRELIGAEIQRRMGLAEWAANALMPGTALVALGLYSLDLNDVSPERAVAEISPRPILLIHGEDDPITPVEHAKRLAAAAPAAELWILPGLGHTEGVRLAPDFRQASPLREAYLRKIGDFFQQALR